MILAVILLAVVIAAACYLLYMQQRKNSEQLEQVRQEILAEIMQELHTPLEDDEEYWKMLRHDIAADMLISYFSGDAGLPNEEEMTQTILRYVDALIDKLRNGGGFND